MLPRSVPSTRSAPTTRRAGVVLDVAGPALGEAVGGRAAQRLTVGAALELGQDAAVRFAQDVGQDVEPSAMGHAQHDGACALSGGVGDELVQHRDQHAQALDGKAGLSRVGAMQKALESGHFGQTIQKLALVDGVVRRAKAVFFDGVEEPDAFVRVFDVGNLVAGRVTVNLYQASNGIQGSAEAGPGDGAAHDGCGQASQFLLPQAVRGVCQVRVAGRLGAKRVDVRGAVAKQADALGQGRNGRGSGNLG